MSSLFFGIIYLSESGDRAVIQKKLDKTVKVWLVDQGFTMEFDYATFKKMFPYETEDDEDVKEFVEYQQ